MASRSKGGKATELAALSGSLPKAPGSAGGYLPARDRNSLGRCLLADNPPRVAEVLPIVWGYR
jgi:hypothetical protein